MVQCNHNSPGNATVPARGNEFHTCIQCFVPDSRPAGATPASAVPKMRVNGRGEDVIFFDGVFFKSSLKSIFFVS